MPTTSKACEFRQAAADNPNARPGKIEKILGKGSGIIARFDPQSEPNQKALEAIEEVFLAKTNYTAIISSPFGWGVVGCVAV